MPSKHIVNSVRKTPEVWERSPNCELPAKLRHLNEKLDGS
jgi:hypothetical protein